MAYIIVIPARYGSSRLPGKPLLDIHGKSLVQRVWEQAKLSSASRVVIATDDERIRATAQGFGAQVCMTSASHPSGTDRLQEVAAQLRLPADAILVNVQGDEPLIPPQVIDQVADNLARFPHAGIATLCEKIHDVADLINPNVVKVVRDAQEMALYFSRAPVPFPRDAFAQSRQKMPGEGDWYRHIGIYAYRTSFLHQFVTWLTAPQENLECLEQLRALHNGIAIHVAQSCQAVPAGVDTLHDLEQVRSLLSGEA
jgi:3-deoxy-manno-octulosonate cytidylyltransferase (CMP-KDO synthetase)